MMSSYYDGSLSPSWVRSRRNRPSGYNKIYDDLKEFNGTVKTEKVTRLLQKSGLQSQQIDRIWNLINKKSSSLSEQDFCILLAFVALSQKGTHVFDIKTLFKLVQPPPVPDFTKPIPTLHENPAVIIDEPFGQMHSYTKESHSKSTDSSMDDEFSDFQSGLTTSTPIPKSQDIFSASVLIDRPSVTSPLPQKPIPFSPIHVHNKAHHGSGSEREVGSRLANYNLGYSASGVENGRSDGGHAGAEIFIGEEDKYSAFRILLEDTGSAVSSQPAMSHVQNPMPITNSKMPPNFNAGTLESIPKQQFSSSVDSDFGDFQSFTETNPIPYAQPQQAKFSGSSLIDAPVTIPPISMNPFNFNPHVVPIQNKSEAEVVTVNQEPDDFGDFVSFTENSTSIPNNIPDSVPVPVPAVAAPTVPPVTSAIFPSIVPIPSSHTPTSKPNLLDQDLNSFDLTNLKYEFKVPSADTHSQNSQDVTPTPSPNLNSRFRGNNNSGRSLSFSFDITSPSPPPAFNKLPLKTTKIGNTNSSNTISLLDPFDEFASFESSPESGNGDLSGSGSFDQNQSLGQNYLTTSSPYEMKLKQSSPETQSVCSLDLGNYGSWETTEGPKSENTDSGFSRIDTPGSKDSGSALFASGDGNDKYNCFKEELESTKTRCTMAWKRCMRVCVRLIENAGTIFNSVSSSDLIRQVISSEKGKQYVLGLREVYLVACRVYHSWMKLSADDTAGHLHKKLALAWDSFVPFLVGSALEDNINQACVISEDDLSDSSHVCGICLIGTKILDNFDDDAMSLLLDYGGSLYHLSCANLWVNEIDAVLPSLYK